MKKIIPLLLGIILIIVGICAVTASNMFKNNATEVMAIIENITEIGDDSKETISYRLRLKYEVDGKKYYYYYTTTEENRDYLYKKYKVGNDFKIYYDKTNPNSVNISSEGNMFFGIVTIIAGIILTFISILILKN